MNYEEAQRQLRYVLTKQQTIGIPRLKRILEAMEFDRLSQSNKDLRRQNKKLRGRIERLKNVEG
ncbi:hypothetical protein [Oceanobacillus alkalisoli]|uniref:hypothetical protein n=1 Tax=Oceanobacillus alkalisoli TaxID=2925113 RepID=UPI001EE4480F|nr:hypothetical protein [Oceanobacillus alkalisoli]MCG5104421.1 hypothetical protein [Oceanobacillus alkalisoli]